MSDGQFRGNAHLEEIRMRGKKRYTGSSLPKEAIVNKQRWKSYSEKKEETETK